jgi:hypothetical protein
MLQIIQKIKEKKYRFVIAKDCYSVKLDLLTNATVVDDAIRFVSKSSEKSHFSNNKEEEESKELDYDEDKDQLAEEQEEETGELTVNHVF